MAVERSTLFRETYQQDMGRHLSDLSLAYALARACVPHNIAVVQELQAQADPLSFYRKIVAAYGPRLNTDGQEIGSDLYKPGVGWISVPLADLIRNEGGEVCVHNLNYDQPTNLEIAHARGRVRSDREVAVLDTLSEYDGPDRTRWLSAVIGSRALGHWPIVTRSVPLMNGYGYGPHRVVVLSVADEVVFFDPDKAWATRYKQHGLRVPAERLCGKNLDYRMPLNQFAQEMSGEIMHVLHRT